MQSNSSDKLCKKAQVTQRKNIYIHHFFASYYYFSKTQLRSKDVTMKSSIIHVLYQFPQTYGEKPHIKVQQTYSRQDIYNMSCECQTHIQLSYQSIAWSHDILGQYSKVSKLCCTVFQPLLAAESICNTQRAMFFSHHTSQY